MARYRTLDTRLVHAGTPEPRVGGAVVTPIFQSSTYEMDGAAEYDAIRYLRLSTTPTHAALTARLAAIEGAEAALVCASGMAAISVTLLGLLSAGDHLLAQDQVYGGTASLLGEDLPRLGIAVTRVNATRPDAWAAALRPETRLFYVEGLTNPLLEVTVVAAVAAFCREHGLLAVIDNTFLSPVNLRPLEHGFHLVLHSATKYLNGHSDLVAGAVAGSAELVARVLHAQNHLGGSLDAHACFLLDRGLKTLALRVRRQNQTALALARALAGHPAVRRVRYPGLPEHPGHARAAELFDGFGGMLAFEAASARAAERFLDAVQLAVHAPSLGGVETLVVRPSRSSHAGLSPEARAALGITDATIRVSVGLEDPDELIEDFGAALG